MNLPEKIARLITSAKQGSSDVASQYLELRSGLNAQTKTDVLEKLTQVRPDIENLWKELAEVYRQQDMLQAGEYAGQQFALISQFNSDLNAANLAFNQREYGRAESLCRDLLTKVPGEVRALQLMAKLAFQHKRLDIALNILKQCYQSRPDDLNIRVFLAQTLMALKQPHQVLTLVSASLVTFPDQIELREVAAEACIKTGSFENALTHYQHLLKHHTDKSTCHIRIGAVYKIIGETDKAKNAFRQAIEQLPESGEAYWALANLKTHQFDDDDISAMKMQLDSADLTDPQRVYFNFTLGKAFEDKQAYEESFRFYTEANQLNDQKQVKSTPSSTKSFMDFFHRDYFTRRDWTGHDSEAPIFVIGLPRSGSTLVEQILSSHSLVDGTMELSEIPSIAGQLNRLTKPYVSGYPSSLSLLTKDHAMKLAEQYLSFAETFRGGGKYFVDKLPANFQHVGLIKTLFPNARIIDVRRHPMACGWSIYTQFFAGGVQYAYDLKKIGQHINNYNQLMQHWHKVLPGLIYTVDYESLILDFENTIRGLLDYCQLPIERSCFDFHHNKRPVATPSAQQVRQPIYNKALDHWRNFAPFLSRLREELNDEVMPQQNEH